MIDRTLRGDAWCHSCQRWITKRESVHTCYDAQPKLTIWMQDSFHRQHLERHEGRALCGVDLSNGRWDEFTFGKQLGDYPLLCRNCRQQWEMHGATYKDFL